MPKSCRWAGPRAIRLSRVLCNIEALIIANTILGVPIFIEAPIVLFWGFLILLRPPQKSPSNLPPLGFLLMVSL